MPFAAGRGGGRAFENDDRAAARQLAEQIARDVSRQCAVVGADEGDAPSRCGAGDDVEERNVGHVKAQDGVVDRGLVHRHEHRRIGPFRDGSRYQGNLLRHAVGLLGDIVNGGGAEPGRGPVGTKTRGFIGRIGPVFRKHRDARHV